MRRETVLDGNVECWNCGIHWSHRRFSKCPDCDASIFPPSEPIVINITTPTPPEPIIRPVINRRFNRRRRTTITEQTRVELIDDEIEPIEVPNPTDIDPIDATNLLAIQQQSIALAQEQISQELRTSIDRELPGYGIHMNQHELLIYTPTRIYAINGSPTYIIDSTNILTSSSSLPLDIFEDPDLAVSHELIARGVTDENGVVTYYTVDNIGVSFPDICRITYMGWANTIHTDTTTESTTSEITINEEDVPFVDTEEFEELEEYETPTIAPYYEEEEDDLPF